MGRRQQVFCTCQKGSEETLSHDYFAAGYDARWHRASIARQSVIIVVIPEIFKKTTTLDPEHTTAQCLPRLSIPWVEPGFTAKSYAIALIFRQMPPVKG
jgi:hypothetical protein